MTPALDPVGRPVSSRFVPNRLFSGLAPKRTNRRRGLFFLDAGLVPITSEDSLLSDFVDCAKARVLAGESLSRDDALELWTAPADELYAAAAEITQRLAPRRFNFCSIVNAKSGRCTEDCRWCAQSRHFRTDAPEYPLIDEARTLEAARRTAAAGIPRFSFVTSGRKLSPREVRDLASLVRTVRRETGLEVCVSAGLLQEEELRQLYEAGVVRYHCNLEASPRFFGTLCTTHTTQDKIATLEAARRVGMELCSGGIVGMGESPADRIDLALTLRNLDIPSVPVNLLAPIPGTPLENEPLLSEEDFLRTVAVFRFLLPTAHLRFAGGRARLSEETVRKALAVGITSAIAGDLLTTVGSSVEEDKARVRDAGYELDDDLAFDRAHLWHPYTGTIDPTPVYKVERTEGSEIILSDGRRLLDGTSSWWCALHGYGDESLKAAMHAQIEAMSHIMFGGLTHRPAVELGRRILRHAPQGLQKIFYADSGSVAVEIAMKAAVQYQVALGRTKRTNFATPRQGYHGDTWNAMSVCDPVTGMHRLFGDALPGRFFVPAPKSRFDGEWDPQDEANLRAVFTEHGDEIAAFILEPIVQGASAMWFYHPEYLRATRRLCDEFGILWIADEIATGFGRTGRYFACEWAGVSPDLMTIGKGLTGGMMTLAAVLTTNDVADTISRAAPHALMHGPTFMANPLACAAGIASLDRLESCDWQADVKRIESQLKAGLSDLRGKPGVRDVRALGALGVVELETAPDLRAITKAFVDAGVWVRPFGRIAYLMPPFVMTEDEVQRLIAGFRAGLRAHGVDA